MVGSCRPGLLPKNDTTLKPSDDAAGTYAGMISIAEGSWLTSITVRNGEAARPAESSAKATFISSIASVIGTRRFKSDRDRASTASILPSRRRSDSALGKGERAECSRRRWPRQRLWDRDRVLYSIGPGA